jgi:hypothetical protein
MIGAALHPVAARADDRVPDLVDQFVPIVRAAQNLAHGTRANQSLTIDARHQGDCSADQCQGIGREPDRVRISTLLPRCIRIRPIVASVNWEAGATPSATR